MEWNRTCLVSAEGASVEETKCDTDVVHQALNAASPTLDADSDEEEVLLVKLACFPANKA